MPVPEALSQLFRTAEPPELGPGPRIGVQTEGKLNQALDKALHGSALPSNNQQLIRALALLWHDHLEPAHVIAQGIENADGAYVHGIMHRREPDFSNAAYWFRRVGEHPSFGRLAQRVWAAGNAGKDAGAPRFSTLVDAGAPRVARNERALESFSAGNSWDPFAFIKQCENAKRNGLPDGHLREIQRSEFEVLLEWLCGEG